MTEIIEWLSCDDLDFMKQRLTWIDGLRPATNSKHQGVIIFSRRAPISKWSNLKGVEHTLSINMGPYGEDVHQETFPVRTHIRKVKAEAERLLAKYRAEGKEIVSD